MGSEQILAERMRYARLFDLYGTLLTEKQRKAFELHDMEDLSLSEIAELLGVSRQGAHDLLQRGRERLVSAEESLRIEARERLWNGELHSLKGLFAEYEGELPEEFAKRLKALLAEMEEGLRAPELPGSGKEGRPCLTP